MAVNTYNSRNVLNFSPVTSENDMDDVFHKQLNSKNGTGLNGLGLGGSNSKTRCLSDPLYCNGKDNLKKEKGKKAPALSDSSNVLKQKPGHDILQNSKSTGGVKSDFSIICEERSGNQSLSSFFGSTLLSDKLDTLPEPECLREISLGSSQTQISDEEENIPSGRAHLGIVENLDMEAMDRLDNDTMFMRDVVFQHQSDEVDGAVIGEDGLGIETEHDDDDSYPSIEHYPHGYSNFMYDDIRFSSIFTPDTTRIMIPSYDQDTFPELPDDILSNESSYYSEYQLDLCPAIISDVPVPSTSLNKMLLEENW